MAKKIFSRRTLALVMALVMCFSMFQVTAQAAPAGRWNYNFYLCHEYLGNAAGAAVKPDPLGYGFQGVFTDIVFTDDNGVTWTFNWNTAQNGDWKASGSGVSEETAKQFPATTDGKVYYGFCGGLAYAFTITTADVPSSWTWVSDSSRATNWCGYIRFIREYTVNVFYQNETGTVIFNGERFTAEAPLVQSFNFKYPDDGQIEDSENEDSDYTSPTTLLPEAYLPQSMKDLGYEIKYATDAAGNDVLTSGVTISLLGENVLNVYCTLIPPKTENYSVVHSYYTEGTHDGIHDGGTIEVKEDSDFAQVVAGITKQTVYNGNTYSYISYAVDAANKVITLTYSRQLPTYNYALVYNANFGAAPETKGDSENVTGTYAEAYTIGVDANSFTRDNYTFTGWNTAADGSGTAYAAGDSIALTAENNTVTLYAQWAEHPKYDYSVTYNANFGTSPATKADSENAYQIYAASYTIGVDTNSFSRSNYTFLGWALDPNGEVVYQPGDVISFTEGGSQVLYAKWIEHDKYGYSVIYNGNGGALAGGALAYGDSENVSGTYNTSHSVGVDANSFLRDNYIFIGWNTAADGSGTAYAAGSTITLTPADNTRTLYAQWAENAKYDYSVIYNANFGEVPATRTDSESITQTYAASYEIGVDENTFLRENYTFLGWNTAADGSGTAYAAGDTIALTAENNTVTLYAQWSEHPKYDYQVLYNANFGASPAKKTDAESISGIYATTHTVNVDANSFVRENYTFIGWNTSADGNGTAYAPGSKVHLTAQANTATLYAQWVENDKFDYALIYNANFGADPATMADGESVSQTYALKHSIGVDANSFVRENYTFAGWNTAADGSGTAYEIGQTVALTAENNTATLYAQWVENAKHDYSVIYNANFGAAPETKADSENVAQTYAVTYVIGIDENSFVRENYTFLGWAFTAGGDVAIQAGESITFTQDGSQTLYAKWAEHDKYSYTVTYNGNGGALTDGTTAYGDSENIAQTYVTAAQIGVDANGFIRENYTFVGWNTAADGSGKAYKAEDVLKLTAKNNTATLYAQWEENAKYDYAVIYEGNFEGAAEAKADSENVTQTYAAAHTIGVDANSFEREGYTFSGWATSPAGKVVYQAGDAISFTEGGSQTLYAIWTINEYEYTIEYVVRVDGGEYEKFTGELPEGAPQKGTVPYGTVINEEFLENLPESIGDGTYVYDFTGIDEITVPYGTNTVIVYYTYISPDPPAQEPPAPPAEEPAQQNDDGLVDIPDEEVPLADVPKTGDPMLLYVGLTAISGMGLLGLKRKSKEEDEEE